MIELWTIYPPSPVYKHLSYVTKYTQMSKVGMQVYEKTETRSTRKIFEKLRAFCAWCFIWKGRKMKYSKI